MLTMKRTLPNGSETYLLKFRDLGDLASTIKHRKYSSPDCSDSWAGGSFEDFYKGCAVGDTEYSKRSEKLLDKFTNTVLSGYDRVLEWNHVSGVLDMQAANSGDPLCLYGPTIELTDAAPVVVYLDMFISASISASVIERRGVAALALVQALSIFRPVQLKVIIGMAHRPTSTNIVALVPVPTAPMDLARVSWMLASPLFPRRGLYHLPHMLGKSDAFCSGPALGNGDLLEWQQKNLGKWVAKEEGVAEVVYIPMMFGGDQTQWESDDIAAGWIKDKLQELVINP